VGTWFVIPWIYEILQTASILLKMASLGCKPPDLLGVNVLIKHRERTLSTYWI
jgi:hypothetical protein